VDPSAYAELALHWRDEGAQIVGGCCGTTPAHISAARERLAGTKPGRPRSEPLAAPHEPSAERAYAARPWVDDEGRNLYPLPFPALSFDPDVFVPTVGSLLMWRHLLRERVGAGKRCLDVGCGSGLLAIQLALNGAASVHAVDIQREAVANTLANAFRNGVADRVTGAEIDLYMVEPTERYDVVVASLYQMPVDPFGQFAAHRPVDFWGRNLVDHLVGLLPRLLADDGYAILLQLSILSQRQTEELLDGFGLRARVADFGFFPFTPLFEENRDQIERVEQLSDAYHLRLREQDVMAAYLLEITRV
jgi:SAM-dependent methyltransferase